MINIIERNCVGYHNNPIVLKDWEKEIINRIYDEDNCIDESIKKIWIIAPRKQGVTTFLKMLHYFRPPQDAYIVEHNMEYAKHLNDFPGFIKVKHYKAEGTNGVRFQIPASYRNIWNKLEDASNRYIYNIDGVLYTADDADYKFEIMLETSLNEVFDVSTYKVIKSFNPSFWTLGINSTAYNNNKHLQELVEEDKGKAIILFINDDGSYEFIK